MENAMVRAFRIARVLPFLIPFHPLAGQEYQVDLSGGNRVSFISDAPLEDFEGVTDRVDGFVFIPGDAPLGDGPLPESEFYFEVDLASLDTGISLRNRHMRENYLDTEEYPFASLSGRIRGLRMEGEGSLSVVVRGDLTIHGVTRERDIACRATPEEEGAGGAGGSGGIGPLAAYPRLLVKCAFRVSLSDHNIPIPKIMFMKIDEVMDLEVDLFLQMTSPEAR